MAPDQSVVDLAAVRRWMDARGLGEGPLEQIAAMTGGTQNIMLRFRRADRPYVLRRGPEHLRKHSNASIMRECRVLAGLGGTPVPHPSFIAACEDPSVLAGAVFYLMEPVEGFNAGVELPSPHADEPSLRHRMGLEMARSLAALAEVDHEAVGLAGFGKPDGFLERQVGRWLGELATYDDLEGYPGPEIGDVQGLARWLDERRPARFAPGILHGDYHASNVMFARTGPEVAAIVDWEMSTIGDPLLDLGWLLATWDLPGGSADFGGRLMEAGGVATQSELVEAYAAAGGARRDLDRMDWYVVLACLKLGIILEGTHARACAGLAPVEVGDRLHDAAVRLLERAQSVIDG
ncbi:phosphotransferase family protein [Nocardioides sp. BP30]|uniref:phosphotransferase family protein n=1 Tax=Nocardioides sp. BP30 TaxID=3036374 RepID=UPI0024684302|nr:phosphotransferase family protein [Nocardioides sp. BP30]WGL54001.1 phosphotransferase family protein [Nocardioides sp. BP30]